MSARCSAIKSQSLTCQISEAIYQEPQNLDIVTINEELNISIKNSKFYCKQTVYIIFQKKINCSKQLADI